MKCNEKIYKNKIKLVCPNCGRVCEVNERLYLVALEKNGVPCFSCLLKKSMDINLVLTPFEKNRENKNEM